MLGILTIENLPALSRPDEFHEELFLCSPTTMEQEVQICEPKTVSSSPIGSESFPRKSIVSAAHCPGVLSKFQLFWMVAVIV